MQIIQTSTLHIILPSVLPTCFEPNEFIPKRHYIVGYDIIFFNTSCEKIAMMRM